MKKLFPLAGCSLAAAFLSIVSSTQPAFASPPPLIENVGQTNSDDSRAQAAREAIENGRFGEAVVLLEALIAPRHHSLPIRSEWHFDLARAYSALGFVDAAQAQYRMAMASSADSDTGVLSSLGDLIDNRAAGDLMPDVVGPDGAKYYNLRWVDRGGGEIDFSSAFVLPQDAPSGAAYMTAVYRADCGAFKTRMLRGGEFSAHGKRIRDFKETEFATPANALAGHALAMICVRDPELKQLRIPSIDGVRLTKHYRELRQMLQMLASLQPGPCSAYVGLFVARLSEEGQVSSVTWQIKDWWDIAAEDLSETEMDAAGTEAQELSVKYPAIAEAMQSHCVKKAIAAGAVPGM